MNRWELPEGWEWTTIGAVGEVRLGRQRTPEHHSGPNMRPYLRVANVHEGRIDTSDVKEMNFTDAEFEIFKLREGDVLLNEGQSKEFVGRPAIFKGEVPGACFQNTLVRFRASKDVNPEYAYQLFRHYMHAGHFQEIAKITTSIAHLGGDRFASRPFPLPPLQEQTRIAERLNALQARITTARAGLDELRQLATALKRAVLDAAFRGDLTATWRDAHPDTEPASALLDRLRAERRRRWQEAHPKKPYVAPEPVDPTDLPELPEGWCWATLEELTPSDAPIVYGIVQAGPHIPDGIPYIRPTDIKGGAVDVASLLRTTPDIAADYRRSMVEPGDLIYSIVGTIGKWLIVGHDLRGANITQSSVRLRPAAPLTGRYFAYALSAPPVTAQIQRMLFGNAVQRLNVDHVRHLAVPLPPAAEWHAMEETICATLQKADAVADAARALAADLITTEHALLTAAFRGELVTEPPTPGVTQDPTRQPLIEAAGGASCGR